MFIAPFVPSPNTVVEYMLKLSGLRAGEVIFDLGSGDGRTVIMAAKIYGARGVGVELREDLAKKAMGTIHENGLEDRVTIVNSDMFNVNLTEADVVYLYLTTSANEKLKPKMEKELRPGTRIVSHDFRIPGWEVKTTEQVLDYAEVHMIHLYVR
jgi:tRNA A58 N-methylase Trm61